MDVDEDGTMYYRHSKMILMFTWGIYVLSCVVLFMIFMNFIITVIGDTYSRVIQNKDAHDYKERMVMIYEREVHFKADDFQNQTYFPNILIIRKKKDQHLGRVTNMQGWVTIVKNYVKS